ncbi:MAG: EscU/YscU/HrcU family type III secretion system export apparatus switch protein [Myxococcales bacterium]|nr:EscU/YscU/HrcU family type III secretion system export apparatus switch protein [Myxococcales bacterium]
MALRYDASEAPAPRVLAKGAGLLADRIIELARQSGVPVREDRDLVAVLAAVDAGDQIPAEAYRAVAAILTHLYRVNARLRDRS